MSVAIPMKGRRGVFAGIYKITSPSGKVYIGQSWDILERWRHYKSSYPLRSQPKIANSLRKHGAASHKFEIVVWFSAGCNQAALDEHECREIAEHRARGVALLNLRDGGRSGRPAPESSAKMVATRRANGSYSFSDETRERMSASRKGKSRAPLSPEHKEKLRQLFTGRSLSDATKEKLRITSSRFRHSPESKAKIGAANRGNKRPDLAEYNRSRRGQPRHKRGPIV